MSVHLNESLQWPYWIVKKLYEWHFDVNGLIEKGLAINILELEKQR